jgi:hypothetical protein
VLASRMILVTDKKVASWPGPTYIGNFNTYTNLCPPLLMVNLTVVKK